MAYKGITRLKCDHCGEKFTGVYEEAGLTFMLHDCPHFGEPDDDCEACCEDEEEKNYA
jgi:hypothetical protein